MTFPFVVDLTIYFYLVLDFVLITQLLSPAELLL